MKCVDTRHNWADNETYRRYKCPVCEVVIHTTEYEVISNEAFHKEWNQWDRRAVERRNHKHGVYGSYKPYDIRPKEELL